MESTNHTLSPFVSTFSMRNDEPMEESLDLPAQPNFSDSQANTFHLHSPNYDRVKHSCFPASVVSHSGVETCST